MFVKVTNIIVLYVDDCIILTRTKVEADKIFNGLSNKGYKITDEGTMEEYLGILITHADSGTSKMSQLL